MNQLKYLIEKSQEWVSVERGRELFSRVAEVLQESFEVDAGMFVYRKEFMTNETRSKTRIFEPWGLQYSLSELTQFIPDGEWLSGDTYNISERWVHISELSPNWRKIWTDAGIQYVGAWKLKVKRKIVGAIVVGRKSAPEVNNEDMMAVCATHISIILEMLLLRRIAEHASYHDPLTNVLNRRGFEEQFTRLLSKNKISLAVCILDLNGFKEINDSFGHLEGDSILADVAKTLREKLSEQGIVARFGGDEFVFAVRLDDELNVEHATQQVHVWFETKEYSVSIGCALVGRDGLTLNSCLSVADQRLYNTKFSRRGCKERTDLS